MEIVNVSKAFDKKLFSKVNLRMGVGLFLLEGESGSGKSTLLNIIAGLERPDSGLVRFGSFSWNEASKKKALDFRRNNISFLSQKFGTFFNFLSLGDNIKVFLGKQALSTEKFRQLCRTFMFIDVGKPVYLLSGGERKKAELIFMLLKEVPVYLLDEPFANLDSKSAQSLCNILLDLSSKSTVLISYHGKMLDDLKSSTILDIHSLALDSHTSELKYHETKSKTKKFTKRLFLSCKLLSLYKSTSAIRIGLVLISFVLFGFMAAFFPVSTAQEIAIRTAVDPYSYLMLSEMKMSGSQNYLSIVKSNTENAKVTLESDDGKTIFITSNNVTSGEISYLEINRSIDLEYSTSASQLSLYDTAQNQTGTVDINISEKKAFANDLNELPSIAKYAIDEGANPVFLNPTTLNYILGKGGLSSIRYENGNPLTSAFPNYLNLIKSENELSQNPQDLSFFYLSDTPSSDDTDSGFSLAIDDSSEIYISLPNSYGPVDILNSFVGDYATQGIEPKISTDGKAHISTSFLLDYEIVSANITNYFTAFTPVYGSGFFPSKALMNELYKEGYVTNPDLYLTAIPTGNDNKGRVPLFYIALACFTFFILLTLISLWPWGKNERETRRKANLVLVKEGIHPLDGSLVFNSLPLCFLALAESLSFIVYAFAFIPLSNHIYFVDSTGASESAATKDLLSGFNGFYLLKDYYLKADFTKYTAVSISSIFLLSLLLVLIFAVVGFLSLPRISGGKNDRTSQHKQSLR